MGVSCDRLKLGSTVALNCQTGQSKGRYFAKKSSHFYLLRCSVPWIQMCKIIIFLKCPPCPSQLLSLGISWMAL